MTRRYDLLLKSIFAYSLLFFTPLLAESEIAEMPAREQSMWQSLVMVAIVMAFFYFILWRPEQRRRKALETLRTSLKQGDRVIALGIVGTIVRIEQDTVILKMYDGSKIEVLKGAISDLLGEAPGDTQEKRSSESAE